MEQQPKFQTRSGANVSRTRQQQPFRSRGGGFNRQNHVHSSNLPSVERTKECPAAARLFLVDAREKIKVAAVHIMLHNGSALTKRCREQDGDGEEEEKAVEVDPTSPLRRVSIPLWSDTSIGEVAIAAVALLSSGRLIGGMVERDGNDDEGEKPTMASSAFFGGRRFSVLLYCGSIDLGGDVSVQALGVVRFVQLTLDSQGEVAMPAKIVPVRDAVFAQRICLAEGFAVGKPIFAQFVDGVSTPAGPMQPGEASEGGTKCSSLNYLE